MEDRWPRTKLDGAEYGRGVQSRPCFICRLVRGDTDSRSAHEVVYEDEDTIVFLNRYPTVYGYTLVAPRQHREQVTGDFSVEEYLSLQSLIYRVSEAMRAEIPTERLYLLSLGSQQGNRHVHWHLVPLPPGVPYEKQQLAAVAMSIAGILQIPRHEQAALAMRIGARLRASA